MASFTTPSGRKRRGDDALGERSSEHGDKVHKVQRNRDALSTSCHEERHLREMQKGSGGAREANLS